jgi:hypothetical protein
LAVTDSAVNCPKQSGASPSHALEKAAAINAVVFDIPDNTLCHVLQMSPKTSESYFLFGQSQAMAVLLATPPVETIAAGPSQAHPEAERLAKRPTFEPWLLDHLDRSLNYCRMKAPPPVVEAVNGISSHFCVAGASIRATLPSA